MLYSYYYLSVYKGYNPDGGLHSVAASKQCPGSQGPPERAAVTHWLHPLGLLQNKNGMSTPGKKKGDGVSPNLRTKTLSTPVNSFSPNQREVRRAWTHLHRELELIFSEARGYHLKVCAAADITHLRWRFAGLSSSRSFEETRHCKPLKLTCQRLKWQSQSLHCPGLQNGKVVKMKIHPT